MSESKANPDPLVAPVVARSQWVWNCLDCNAWTMNSGRGQFECGNCGTIKPPSANLVICDIRPPAVVSPVVARSPESWEALRDELLRQAHALEFGADSRTLTGAHATIAIAKAQAYRDAANRLAALVPRPEPREPEPAMRTVAETIAEMRSGAALSRQFGTPAADAELLDAWADQLDAAVRPASAPSLEPKPDVVCEHGTAMDVHCCNCHSGFIFDRDHECPAALDYVKVLNDAKAIVNASVLYKKFIDGTPLENDIAVWMADFVFAQHEAASAPSSPLEEREWAFLLDHTRTLLEHQHHHGERVETCDAPSCVLFRSIRDRLRVLVPGGDPRQE